jgi:ribosomal protein S12 methylthiotransferase accessory factor
MHGTYGSAGPLFLSGQPPCWECMAIRMWLNGQQEVSPAAERAACRRVLAIAVREASAWLTGGNCRVIGRWIAVSEDGSESSHAVIPACSSCLKRSNRVPLLACRLESEITGIVAHLETRQFHEGLYRSTAICSQTLVPDHALRFFPETRLSVDGKGETRRNAIRSCLGEAVERYSIMFQGTESRTRAAYRDVMDTAIHPGQLVLASTRQYQNSEWWRRRHGSFHWVKEPAADNCEVDWVDARDVSTGAIRLVPAEYCFLGYGGRFADANSNGCAAGATKWEAARNAVLELIERDAVAIWWYNRLRHPVLDWRSLRSERIERLASILKGMKREFWLLDVTTDLGIPVCAAVSHDSGGDHIALGTAAGITRESAAWKAMAEMVTLVFGMPALRRPPRGNLYALWRWWHRSRLAGSPYLRGAGKTKNVICNTPSGPHAEFRRCVQRIEEAGMRVLLYDHTRPELGIPVMRVIAPGLRHFWARFAPGRLYDVPVRLGWLPKPRKESELNPVPYFL